MMRSRQVGGLRFAREAASYQNRQLAEGTSCPACCAHFNVMHSLETQDHLNTARVREGTPRAATS